MREILFRGKRIDNDIGVLHSRTVIPLIAWDNSQFEVIGNIHDNTELLEVEK